MKQISQDWHGIRTRAWDTRIQDTVETIVNLGGLKDCLQMSRVPENLLLSVLVSTHDQWLFVVCSEKLNGRSFFTCFLAKSRWYYRLGRFGCCHQYFLRRHNLKSPSCCPSATFASLHPMHIVVAPQTQNENTSSSLQGRLNMSSSQSA